MGISVIFTLQFYLGSWECSNEKWGSYLGSLQLNINITESLECSNEKGGSLGGKEHL